MQSIPASVEPETRLSTYGSALSGGDAPAGPRRPAGCIGNEPSRPRRRAPLISLRPIEIGWLAFLVFLHATFIPRGISSDVFELACLLLPPPPTRTTTNPRTPILLTIAHPNPASLPLMYCLIWLNLLLLYIASLAFDKLCCRNRVEIFCRIRCVVRICAIRPRGAVERFLFCLDARRSEWK
jgi:hypothetical protein